MKVRIKFAKSGVMVYIGHLDILRYFQKSMRRAEIDIKYSEGFSPHQIMSFAHPLGVGVESEGDYFDVELNSMISCQDVKDKLNSVMVPGMEILNVVVLDDKAKNAMASVAAARYRLSIKQSESLDEPSLFDESVYSGIEGFLRRDTIVITKETKKNTLEIDIKPHIYELQGCAEYIEMLVDASSSGNIKPLVVLEELYRYAGIDFTPENIKVRRIDIYTDSKNNNSFIPLDAI